MAGVAKVSGLNRVTEVVSHREGGEPNAVHKSPGISSFEPITLERGLTHDTAFEDWASLVWLLGAPFGAEASLKSFRKDILIQLCNEAGQVVLGWKDLPLLGLRISGAARPRLERQRGRDRTDRPPERRLGTRRGHSRAG